MASVASAAKHTRSRPPSVPDTIEIRSKTYPILIQSQVQEAVRYRLIYPYRVQVFGIVLGLHPALSSADLLMDRRGAIARLSRIPNPASAIPQSQTRSRASQTMKA
jgi:hypothetical protein